DDRFRINVGIRRRLTPLLDGERRRIELMNALLFSLKGSPILYYGDEIGMGDDLFLGDRNSVRTPMQWSPDKNGGFSRAPHHKLFMPPINRGKYSYEFVNVEDAENDPNSLLHFMRRLISIRQQHRKAFGRGRFELIPVKNQSILAFVREYEGERILVVANLSRFAQSAHVPVQSDLQGLVPVELFSQSAFPPLGGDDYHLTVGSHHFYWFKLVPEDDVQRDNTRRSGLQPSDTEADDRTHPVLAVAEGLQNLLVPTMAQHRGPEQLESLLPTFISRQRWFGAKGDVIEAVEVEDAVRLQTDPVAYLSVLKVSLEHETSLYTLPLMAAPEEKAAALLDDHPSATLAWLEMDDSDKRRLIYDATVDPEFWETLFRWWQAGSRGRSLKGVYSAEPSEAAKHDDPEDVQLLTGEQSNTSAIINEDYFLKLYRRLEEGPNPEKELLEHLTSVDFNFSPRLHGTLQFRRRRRQYTLGVLQEALPVDTDAWSYALTSTTRFLDRVENSPFPRGQAQTTDSGHAARHWASERFSEASVPVWLDDVAPELISFARTLGVRTAEMHHALFRAEAEDLHPIEAPSDAGAELAQRLRAEIEDTRTFLDRQDDLPAGDLPPDSAWAAAEDRLAPLDDIPGTHDRIRIHGDYHLGQLLRAEGDVYILDFEGEPARPLNERRKRENALRDVAGMIRSLEYAVFASWQDHTDTDPDYEPWVNALLHWAKSILLDAYADTTGDATFLPEPPARYTFLWAFLFDKALYEVRYEINHRPDWAWLPLHGLRRLLGESTLASTSDPQHS
ncbi:MAG: maltose alpha-D-glucosyltransferase, partial [Bacteroidetes bacterium QH_10_64_19]